MRTLGRTALAGLVWLTAGMTLLAEVPHFDCRCPTGRVKPFCVSFPWEKSTCCCGGGYCSDNPNGPCCCGGKKPSASGKAKNRSCCKQHTQANGDPRPEGRPVATSACCVKTLAQQGLIAPGPAKETRGKDVGVYPVVAAQPASFYPSAGSSPSRLSCSLHLLAPPADLVTLLQRFLI
jgi:hypothetical protein